MENAKYHSVVINKTPTSNLSKGEIAAWLKERNKHILQLTQGLTFQPNLDSREESMYELVVVANKRDMK